MTPTTLTATGAVTGMLVPGKSKLFGFVVATDGVNNPTITMHDNTAASGTILFPATEFDASALGINGMMLPEPVALSNGIYVTITTAGAASVTVYTTTRILMSQIH